MASVQAVPKISSIRSMSAKRFHKWGKIALNRINSESDLIVADVQYHKNCDAIFSIVGSSMPGKTFENVVERLVDESKSAVCDAFFICSDEFLYSTTEDYTKSKCCWKVNIHPNRYSRQDQEPLTESLGNGSRLLLKLRLMDAEIGTTYHRIWMAGPISAEEPHIVWSVFMEIATWKRCYEKSAALPYFNLQLSSPLPPINTCLRFAVQECRKRLQRCIMTFCQPLFIKAMDIVL
ncbi:hypothetical protein AVEN_170234-1 [Araneus ventricosus]|uniref:Uncharacterized protein n=1 Tax=Araneus ventricosus TaxID=182803 RepID=A0A4Y2KEV5_ARAVE|nr:hypothetical protein AVEN_170234-1 [Araneus ventricosus]